MNRFLSRYLVEHVVTIVALIWISMISGKLSGL